MTPAVLPEPIANNAAYALRTAIADPDRYACEPKVDGVRGLVVFDDGRPLRWDHGGAARIEGPPGRTPVRGL